MNEAALRSVLSAAHHCAMVMLENAVYVQEELPRVPMSEALQAQTKQLCSKLISTKHDVITELSELEELLASEPSASACLTRANRLVRWLGEDLPEIHQLVSDLESATKADPECQVTQILITESATNILIAFNQTKVAADALNADSPESGTP